MDLTGRGKERGGWGEKERKRRRENDEKEGKEDRK